MVIESKDGVQAAVDPTHLALRASLRSGEFRGPDGAHIGGHYRTILSTGAATLIAAGGAVLSLRWTNPDRALVLHRIRAFATIGTAFTTAQEVAFDVARLISYTAADTGGTAIELGESCRKERSHMGASQISSLRIATTGALTPGTATEESPIGGSSFPGLLNVVGAMAQATLFDNNPGLEHPLVLQRLEGLRIRNRVTMGAAGVVVFTFELDWSEIPTSLLGA